MFLGWTDKFIFFICFPDFAPMNEIGLYLIKWAKNGRFEVCRTVYWTPNQPEIKQSKAMSGIRDVF